MICKSCVSYPRSTFLKYDKTTGQSKTILKQMVFMLSFFWSRHGADAQEIKKGQQICVLMPVNGLPQSQL